MKQVIGTFFNDNEANFKKFVKLFEDNGYEIARQGGMMQAVVIEEVFEEETEQTEPTE